VSTVQFFKPESDGVCLSLKVQPRASKNEIGEVANGELIIKVTAPPVDAAANEAVLRLLAECLDCPRGAVQLLRGQTSRHKQVFIRGMSVEAVLDKLLPGHHA
jgi:uncharacterized protein (TIGR00251 family)